jgi:hypothetical protein
MSDLVQRLQHAALVSIEDLRPDLERDPSSVRSATIELTVGRDGQIKEAITFVERRVHAGALLDRYVGKAG